jgi:hypothetical protein
VSPILRSARGFVPSLHPQTKKQGFCRQLGSGAARDQRPRIHCYTLRRAVAVAVLRDLSPQRLPDDTVARFIAHTSLSPFSAVRSVVVPLPGAPSRIDHPQPWAGDDLDPPYSTNIPPSSSSPQPYDAHQTTTATTSTGGAVQFPTPQVPSSPSATASGPLAELNDDEIRFVRSLYENNVPAPDVARLIAEMAASRQQKTDGSGPNASAKKGLSPA